MADAVSLWFWFREFEEFRRKGNPQSNQRTPGPLDNDPFGEADHRYEAQRPPPNPMESTMDSEEYQKAILESLKK